ncbi:MULTISPECIES: RICIN domain-containing protein [unclassified Streptomyces]|uniref:RICIN domain-containing protein n=1 Tax=unclassified Streptomyces TaxID=2593676 RepID=UPI003808CA3B
MNPEVGYSYRLKNKRTGTYLTSADFSPSSFATIWPSQSGGQGRLAQSWNVLSLDNGEYLIEQKVGGTILTADNYSSGTVRINLDNPQNGTTNANIRNSQIWILRPEGTGYTFSNKNGGLFLTPDGCGHGNGQVNKYYRVSGADGDSQIWELERETTYDRIIKAEIGPTNQGANPVPAPTGYVRPNPDTTPEVLIGTTILPSPLVTDTALGQARKARESPFYLLKRYGFYKVAYFYDHSGQIAKTESQSTTVGMSTTNAREVETTTGISVTATTSMEYKGFSASLSTTLSYQLRTKVATETTNSSSTTVTVERSYPANGKRLAQSIWFRADRYVLERTDGTKVMEWQTTTDQDTVDSVYPPATA